MSRRMLPLAGAALIALAGCGGDRDSEMDAHQAISFVEVTAAQRQPAVVTAPAKVRSEQTANLATRTSGTIRQVTVEAGDRVRRGQVLVRLDDSNAGAGVERAEADLELARRTHARIEALERDGAATGQELDEATARLRVAEAGVREARGGMDYTELRAPFGGVVTARYADPGDLAVPGRPLLELAGDGDLVVEADLPAQIPVQPGQEVHIESLSGGGSWLVEITRVVPVLDRASQTFRVEGRIRETEGELPVPNSVVTMLLASRVDSVVAVPADAIVTRGQLKGVLLVRDSVLRLRWIRTGAQRLSLVEVLAGLSEGDLVVRRPGRSFVDGQAVEDMTILPWPSEAGAP